jgi:hypothetical protein
MNSFGVKVKPTHPISAIEHLSLIKYYGYTKHKNHRPYTGFAG